MAATSKMYAAKAGKRVGSNLAAQTSAVRSAEDTDTCLKKVGLAEALREEGIDERAIAQGFASLHRKLSGSEDKGDLKLFFDVLKDNHRTLEPPSASERSNANDGPVTIILKHNVPRPAR
jgi:pyruvate/2-oxoglutarate dehydrogenase complex dihydrolipoamide dehydrogenase (E3) component